MIQTHTNVIVADNSGAKMVKCIKVLTASRKNDARLGDMIVVSVKKAASTKKVRNGQVDYAFIVRTKRNVHRKDRSFIRFEDNAVVMINKSYSPTGTRILGPIAAELRIKKYMKIVSLASSVI
jgi:large subunit ribosomal protein L14